MSQLTNQKQNNVIIYDMLMPHSQDKVLTLSAKLSIDKFVFEGRNRWQITYYDTPDNLLTKTGILLYRTIENDKQFLKIEKLNFLPSVTRLRKTETFILPIAPKDTPATQAFYLINGITAMFSTQFYIDLENVIKAVVPKLDIKLKGNSYKALRGDGFKCSVEFQNVEYINHVTKHKFKNSECTITHTSGKSFDDEFQEFLGLIERYAKELLPQTENRWEKGIRLTRALPKIPKENRKEQKKKEKEKKMKVENKIEG